MGERQPIVLSIQYEDPRHIKLPSNTSLETTCWTWHFFVQAGYDSWWQSTMLTRWRVATQPLATIRHDYGYATSHTDIHKGQIIINPSS